MAKASTRTSRSVAGSSLRGRIPALRAAQAEALRQLFARPVCWPLRNERMLAFAPLRRPGGVGGVFALDADGTRLALRLDRSEATGEAVPQWSDYDGRSRLLAWSLAHEHTLMQLSEALGVPLLPVAELEPDAAAAAATDGEALWLSFSIEDLYEPEDGAAPHYQSGELLLPAAWLGRLLGRAEPLDPERPLPELGAWAALPAPVSIGCAGPRLSAAEWAGLRPGDVIVLGSRSRPPPLHADANGRRWPLAANPHDGYRVSGPMQTIPTLLETAMNERDDAPAEAGDPQERPDQGDAARGLPVLVEFELGRLELTLGELAALQPGYVFPLPAFVEGANVTIRANGRASGRGELVAVGDTLGVRLVSWG